MACKRPLEAPSSTGWTSACRYLLTILPLSAPGASSATSRVRRSSVHTLAATLAMQSPPPTACQPGPTLAQGDALAAGSWRFVVGQLGLSLSARVVVWVTGPLQTPIAEAIYPVSWLSDAPSLSS